MLAALRVRSEDDAVTLDQVVDTLTKQPELSPGQLDFLELAGQVLEDWETEQHGALPGGSPQEVVRFLMEANDLKQNDLVPAVFYSPPAS